MISEVIESFKSHPSEYVPNSVGAWERDVGDTRYRACKAFCLIPRVLGHASWLSDTVKHSNAGCARSFAVAPGFTDLYCLPEPVAPLGP